MAGFDNDVMYADNADFTTAGAGGGSSANGLATNGQLWIGTTAVNAGGTHINVGTITSPLGTLSVGYSTPNITVDLAGGTTGVDSFAMQTGTSPVTPNGSGLVTFNGAVVAAGTNPVRTDGTDANTIALEVQTSQALAAADATKIGLSNFDSSSFAVAATGFVTAAGTGLLKTLTGNTGGAISPTANNINIVTANSTVKIAGAGSTLTEDFGISNLMLGSSGASITTASLNTSFGNGALNAVSTGEQNTALGYQALVADNTGSFNTAIGFIALASLTIGANSVAIGYAAGNKMIDGSSNCYLGYFSGWQVLHGSNNIFFGASAAQNIAGTASQNTIIGAVAGSAYTTTESNNILLGYNVPGTIGESNVTRIGSTQSACYIDGIDGVNVGSVAKVVTEASDQLGTATITAGTGITITPTANTITIASSSGGFAWSDTSGAFSPLAQNGYFITGTATGTLPAAPAQGDTIKFFVDHASQVLTIDAPGTQIIRFGVLVSSAGGTFVSTAQGDSVELTYRTSDTCWCAIAGFTGTWTFT